MPEVTVHVTTEPDTKELIEYKASADMWAEQCHTLQRTMLGIQIERDDLVMLVRQLATKLRKVAPDTDLPERAIDYLKRHNLQGSPLR